MAKFKWDLNGRIVSKVAVSPSDTAANEFDALFVGVGGDLATVAVKDADAATYKNIGDGEFIPEACKKVMSTGTTATYILGLHISDKITR